MVGPIIRTRRITPCGGVADKYQEPKLNYLGAICIRLKGVYLLANALYEHVITRIDLGFCLQLCTVGLELRLNPRLDSF
ncbi:MAG: hypothetical protein AVDCRST_MAG93-4041 [uncultured Chloroflexia bacterium]|uniref:Uncharacterized protein n=1 Tax=uncultured Chloroflexia bacterium TaxID=1672391 RepID=A0A6J4K178_9CHLR|nr:MAG: hypothetical protein AVDCRST_MAG93-4041 [uncultured Chloroflexia bacterium]